MKKICVIIIMLLVSACSSSYNERSFFSGGGYEEIQLGENIWQVRFEGNGYTNKEKVEDFTLLRSAEIVTMHNYNYFVIVDNNTSKSTSSYTTPQSAKTTYRDNVAHTTFSGGDIYNTSRYEGKKTIMAFKSKEEAQKNQGVIYNANYIINSIKTKYNIK